MGKYKAMGQVTPSDEVVELGVYDTLGDAELAIVKAGGGASFWHCWTEAVEPTFPVYDVEVREAGAKPKEK
jgi:hypothetical protein